MILDEPTAGLDPNQIRDARALIRELGREHTVIVSTHILSEVEACATRVLLLHRGKVAAQGSTEEIRAMRRSTAAELAVRGDAKMAEQILRGAAHISGRSARPSPRAWSRLARVQVAREKRLTVDERSSAIEACVTALVGAGLGVREVREAGGTLEDVFASLTADEIAKGGEGSQGGESIESGETGGST